ncbi:MAG: HlyD family efflux transporter periplasmic adaptor subunit [Planctomycetota bacterium]|nr:HlyD family efflux transporter periplasmic adaptor subunit [Planctomycetota bacterium]
MSTTQAQTPPKPAEGSETQLPSTDALVERLTELAAESTNSMAFWRGGLALLGNGLGSPCGRIEVREQASEVRVEHGDEASVEFWREPLAETIELTLADGPSPYRLLRGRATGVGVGLFGVALRGGAGALALVVPCRDERAAARMQERIDSLAALLAVLAETVEQAGPSRIEAQERAAAGASAVRRAADYESPVQLAMAIANRLAGREGYDQATFARVKGKRIEILAISGLDHIDRKSPGVAHLEQALAECLDYGEPVVAQVRDQQEPSDEVPLARGRLHQAWHEAVGQAPVCTVPLEGDNGVAAILAVRRAPDAPLDHEEVQQLIKLVGPFARTLGIVERANRTLLGHATEALLAAPMRFFSRHHLGRKLTLAALVALGWWSIAGSMPYYVGTTTTIEPRSQRALATPQDGTLVQAPHGPGVFVTAGSILARFDTGELELEARRLGSELATLASEEKLAIAEGDPTGVQLSRSKRDEVMASLELVQLQIKDATVRAPFDGVLVEGDLRERVGDRFQKGEQLFRLAGQDGYRLSIQVDERDVDEVTPGMEGSFSALVRPEERLPFRVTLLHPSAEAGAATNAFRLEAELLLGPSDAPWARPGMEGIGRIEVGERSPAWLALHRVVDRMRMLSWR